MAIRMWHKEHGYTNVFRLQELDKHKQFGWQVEEEKKITNLGIVVLKETKEAVVEEKKDELAQEQPGFVCDVCGKTYKLKMHLATHRRKHKG